MGDSNAILPAFPEHASAISEVGGGDHLPTVEVAPIYPQRALIRGIGGYCIVQFTLTRKGTTWNKCIRPL